MNPFIITLPILERLISLRDRAAKNVVPREILLKIHTGDIRPIERYADQSLWVPPGYQIVYTQEEQRCGILHHLSVSSPDLPEKTPDLPVVRVISEALIFPLPLQECVLWGEQDPFGEQVAINVLCPLDGDWQPFRVD